jgi:hypothetical protein
MCLACHTRWFEDRQEPKRESGNGQTPAKPKSRPTR